MLASGHARGHAVRAVIVPAGLLAATLAACGAADPTPASPPGERTPGDTDQLVTVETADTATPTTDHAVVLSAAGTGTLSGDAWTGSETWTWTGARTDRVYCSVRYTVHDLASLPPDPRFPRIREHCVTCAFFMTAVAHHPVEASPPGQCAALALPGWERFLPAFRVGYGRGLAGGFFEHDPAAGVWFRNDETVERFDGVTGTWHYEYRATLPWSAP